MAFAQKSVFFPRSQGHGLSSDPHYHMISYLNVADVAHLRATSKAMMEDPELTETCKYVQDVIYVHVKEALYEEVEDRTKIMRRGSFQYWSWEEKETYEVVLECPANLVEFVEAQQPRFVRQLNELKLELREVLLQKYVNEKEIELHCIEQRLLIEKENNIKDKNIEILYLATVPIPWTGWGDNITQKDIDEGLFATRCLAVELALIEIKLCMVKQAFLIVNCNEKLKNYHFIDDKRQQEVIENFSAVSGHLGDNNCLWGRWYLNKLHKREIAAALFSVMPAYLLNYLKNQHEQDFSEQERLIYFKVATKAPEANFDNVNVNYRNIYLRKPFFDLLDEKYRESSSCILF